MDLTVAAKKSVERMQVKPPEPLHLLTNPADDHEFRRAALAALRPNISPYALALALRAAYPTVVIHRRLLANEPVTVWYVYRDGHWVPRSHEREREAIGGDR